MSSVNACASREPGDFTPVPRLTRVVPRGATSGGAPRRHRLLGRVSPVIYASDLLDAGLSAGTSWLTKRPPGSSAYFPARARGGPGPMSHRLPISVVRRPDRTEVTVAAGVSSDRRLDRRLVLRRPRVLGWERLTGDETSAAYRAATGNSIGRRACGPSRGVGGSLPEPCRRNAGESRAALLDLRRGLENGLRCS
jgi:hypothetical protein